MKAKVVWRVVNVLPGRSKSENDPHDSKKPVWRLNDIRQALVRQPKLNRLINTLFG